MATIENQHNKESYADRYVAENIRKAFEEGRGLTVYLLKEKKIYNRVQVYAKIKHCYDIDSLLRLSDDPETVYTEIPLEEQLEDAINAAETYGEKDLGNIATETHRWESIPGFEQVNHLLSVFKAVTRPTVTEQSKLTAHKAVMGADSTYTVVQTPAWCIAIEEVAEPHAPTRVFSTVESLKDVLSE